MNNDLIVKSNDLIEGFMDMSQNEYKFTLYLISKIKKDDINFRKQRVSVQEFGEILNYKGQSLYEYMKGLEETLLNKRIELNYVNGDRLKINWFSYTKYISNGGMLEVAFNNDLAPFLLKLDTNFTKYFLDSVKDLDSEYSIRIYELLKQYEKLTERILDLEDLRQMIGISPTQYKLYGDFKKRVLLIAKKQINSNSKSDITIDLEEIKKGRKVIKIKFSIKSKNKKDTAELDKEKLEIKDPFANELFLKFNKKYSTEIDIAEIDNLIEKYGIEKVEYCVDNLCNTIDLTEPKEKIINYFKKAVKNNWPLEKSKRMNKETEFFQKINFDQREYTDEDYERFYSNVK